MPSKKRYRKQKSEKNQKSGKSRRRGRCRVVAARGGRAMALAHLTRDQMPRTWHRHLCALRMPTAALYLDWCRSLDVPAHFDKWPLDLEEERGLERRRASEAATRRFGQTRRPARTLRRILDRDPGPELEPEFQSVRDLLYAEEHSDGVRRFARRLLRHLSATCPDFLWERTPTVMAAGQHNHLPAVGHISACYEHTIRPIEDWRPPSRNAGRRLADLTQHLFARWELPRFFDSVFVTDGDDADLCRGLYLHLCAGRNIRTAHLPLTYTRKMAHDFLQAPADYSVFEALRWGQVHGMGGDACLAEALRGTRLCAGFTHEDFWATVVRFFAQQPMFDPGQVGPILDYLCNQRFVTTEVVGDDGRVRTLPPPQPGLSMRGRTPQSLLAQAEAWHERLGLRSQRGLELRWAASGLPALRSVEGNAARENQRIWTVRELLCSSQLQAEGRAMRHCVASYARACHLGRSSIWTVELEDRTGRHKVLTFEVDRRMQQIVQARGFKNRRPTAQARSVLARWAGSAGLTIAGWV